MESVSQKEKPTLQQLRQKFGLTLRVVADAARVELCEEYLIEIGVPMERALVLRVLHAVCVLSGRYYGLEEIDVAIKEELAPTRPLFATRPYPAGQGRLQARVPHKNYRH